MLQQTLRQEHLFDSVLALHLMRALLAVSFDRLGRHAARAERHVLRNALITPSTPARVR